ncbi:MAG: SDR family oxidoreductase [Alphaproteobacteria bacterium]
MSAPVAIVTGGSRGIGAAVVRRLASAGHTVCFSHRDSAEDAAAVIAAVTEAGGVAHAVRADVASEADIVALFQAADALGPLAALVNNAGFTGPAGRRVADAEADLLARVFAINVIGPMLAAREAVRRMATGRGGTGGRIVNVSSSAARRGSPGEWVDYAAAKAALDTFTRGLALELTGDGIRVNAVAPGLTDTGLHALAGAPDRAQRLAPRIPLGRAGSADEMARAIAWLVTDAPDYMTGAIVPVDGGF